MPEFKLSTTVDAGIDKVYAVVKDMERFPDFMRDVRSVKILEREGDKQTTEWKIDIDGTPVRWVEEDVFDDGKHSLRFRTVEGDYRYEGSWSLESAGSGKTAVTIRARFDWGVPNFEKYFGAVYERKARGSLRSMLNALRKKFMEDDVFAFLFHPFNLESLASKGVNEDSLSTKDRRSVERSLRWLPPVRRGTAVIRSKTGRAVTGEMILVPLLCEQILNMDQKFILGKTIAAAALAKRSGAKMVGLGAYLSPVGRRGVLVSKAVDLPVTAGTTYTIAIAVEATLAAAGSVGLNIADCNITIIGATGAIGRVCACMLADKVKSLTLAARNSERLDSLKEEIAVVHAGKRLNVRCIMNVQEAVKHSDIVIISTNTTEQLLSVRDLQPGCVVCDVSVPHNISPQDADKADVLVIDGGLVECPCDVHFDYMALPPNVAYACLSEVMILALEGRFESFSCGGDISYDKVMEIQRMADKHGFKLAQFRSFGVAVTPEQIQRVKDARSRRQRMSS